MESLRDKKLVPTREGFLGTLGTFGFPLSFLFFVEKIRRNLTLQAILVNSKKTLREQVQTLSYLKLKQFSSQIVVSVFSSAFIVKNLKNLKKTLGNRKHFFSRDFPLYSELLEEPVLLRVYSSSQIFNRENLKREEKSLYRKTYFTF